MNLYETKSAAISNEVLLPITIKDPTINIDRLQVEAIAEKTIGDRIIDNRELRWGRIVDEDTFWKVTNQVISEGPLL